MSFHIDVWQAVVACVCLCVSSMVGLGFISRIEKRKIQEEKRKKKLLLLGCGTPIAVMFVATLLLGVNLLFFIFSLVLTFCAGALGFGILKQVDDWLQRTFNASPTEIDWTAFIKPFIIGFALEYLGFIILSIHQ